MRLSKNHTQELDEEAVSTFSQAQQQSIDEPHSCRSEVEKKEDNNTVKASKRDLACQFWNSKRWVLRPRNLSNESSGNQNIELSTLS